MDRDEPASESGFLTGYAEADDVNAKYRLLRREATRLRQRAVRPDDVKFTDDRRSWTWFVRVTTGSRGSC